MPRSATTLALAEWPRARKLSARLRYKEGSSGLARSSVTASACSAARRFQYSEVVERRLMRSQKVSRDTGVQVIAPCVPRLPEQRSCRSCIAVDGHASGTEPYNRTVPVNHPASHTTLMTTFPVARPDSE